MTTLAKQLIAPAQQVKAVSDLQAAQIALRLALKSIEEKPELSASDITVAAEHASSANCRLNSLRSLLAGNQLPRNGERE